MLSQGWKAGEGLGARNRRGFNSYDNAKLKVSFKDDNLGLGASLKSKDVEASRTGLDAFQGLLGRLNGKSDAEVEAVERKVEERKLAMFAQGKWGGMVFVSGGLLVQRDDFKANDDVSEEQREFKAMRNDAEAIAKAKGRKKGDDDEMVDVPEEDENTAKARRKQERAEKRQRKEERRRRRKAETSTGLERTTASNEASATDIPKKREKRKKKAKSLPTPPDDTSASNTDADTDDIPESALPPAASRPMPRNGRQMLRGKNIAAKKMAFADAKLLDEIFMRKS